MFKLGSWAASAAWLSADSELKGVVESQHVGVPPEPQVGMTGPRGWVVRAVTLVAKAMAATKETMGLWNSIVKNVV